MNMLRGCNTAQGALKKMGHAHGRLLVVLAAAAAASAVKRSHLQLFDF